MRVFQTILEFKLQRPCSLRELLSVTTAVFSLSVCFVGQLSAYPYDDSLSELPSSVTLNGLDSRTNGTVVTYNIPTSDWPDFLRFDLRGGDGGRARATAAVGSNQTGNGGGGASVQAEFFVSLTDSNSLRPGGELRFILGNKGQDKTRSDAAGAGGGGGSAVLYRAPVVGSSWQILAVAGGGGGGAASTVFNDTFQQNGEDASITEEGSDGKGQGDVNGRDGGQDGDAGVTVDDGHVGGGGSYRATSPSSNGATWNTSGRAGGTSGDQGGESATLGSWGGFGFGSGGGGYVNSGVFIARGGGGGGYSGGGAGGNNGSGDGAGGGGGSYVNPIASGSSITSRDSDALNGAITITAFNLISDDGIPAPTIILNGASSLTVDRENDETYSELGATASDYYGNEITVILSGFDSDEPGEYEVPYFVNDQFGNFALVIREVTILGRQPTFSLAGNSTVNEDSGSYSVNEYAYDFDSNDAGQSLIAYELSNNNNSLFSTQPVIDTSGKLSFTPASNASGRATVSVVAIDNLDDPSRGRSDLRTFTIIVESVDDPPLISTSDVGSNPENSIVPVAIEATEPFGASLIYSISGGHDASLFELVDTILRFKAAPNFESPTDSDQDNIYTVEVTVAGSDGATTLPLVITVTDVNEAPYGVSISHDTIIENTTAIATLTATDPEGGDLEYTITGGQDASFFEIIDGNTLAFKSAPNFESPEDSNMNNYYVADVIASDDSLTSE